MFEAEEHVDLEGDVKVNLDMWVAWMETLSCQCAAAVMRYATDQQGADMRGSVNADTAWELCCRILSCPRCTTHLGTRDIAQLLVYWLEEHHLPLVM